MTNLIDHLVVLLNRLIPRVSDDDVSGAFWHIVITLIHLAYLSTIIYWILQLLEVFHKIGLI